jgi:iron complex outermembrane recepter protein
MRISLVHVAFLLAASGLLPNSLAPLVVAAAEPTPNPPLKQHTSKAAISAEFDSTRAQDLRPPTGEPWVQGQTPPEAEEEEEEEVVITGEKKPAKSPYQPPDSSLGTRTNTPILDVPQGIQVVPQQVIEDRGIRSFAETFRNLSGVQSGRVSPDAGAFSPVIRGFQSENVLRNGSRDETARFSTETANIERVEVLKGPASVLFGQGDLGGTINIVTKQPTDQPVYSLKYQVGQFGVHRPAIDFSGPLGSDGLAYRLNVAYNRADSFKPFEQSESWQIAPVVRLINTETTKLTAEIEYLKSRSSGNAPDLPADGTIIPIAGSQLRFDTNLGDPALSEANSSVVRLGYQLEQKLSQNWMLNHQLLFGRLDAPENTNYTVLRFTPARPGRRPRPPQVLLGLTINPSSESSFNVNQSITGKFATGPLQHQLLVGVEYANVRSLDQIDIKALSRQINILDIVTTPQDASSAFSVFTQDTETRRNSLGIYLQDQIRIGKNLILVLGGRFDRAKLEYFDKLKPTEDFSSTDSVFSPRAGLVFKPVESVSIYAGYSRSFKPVIGRSRSFNLETLETVLGAPFEPETGQQFEVGVKANLLGDRLSATLAYYDLTRQNVTTFDASGSQFQVGKQRSRGVELDIAGELLPGWNLIASYAYADGQITEDQRFAVGNRLVNLPRHAFSLWTTYTLQTGSLKGLGAGFGIYAQGDRPGNLENNFELPGYVRTDAAVFYRFQGWRVGINLQNLGNIRYFEGARSRERVIPGAPFAITGTIAVEF